MKKIITFVFLTLLSCSKDSPVPDAVVPTPTLTFTLAVTASEGGSVNDPGDTHNENTNVSLSATPAEGYAFSGWSGDASGTDNPLAVSMNRNKIITANFIRTQYTLRVAKIGEGTVTQEVISSNKTSEEYNSGDVVRLVATPSSGSIFNSWSGSSTETTNQIDVTIDGTKSVTATFEETINQIVTNDTFVGLGRWIIRTSDNSSKKLTDCELSSIIFRTDGSFTIASGTTNVSGQFYIGSNTTISLIQEESPFGSITNLLLTNGFISFSIDLNSGCSEDVDGDKDDTYDEASDASIPPIISLVGSSIIYLEIGETFTDPGAIAEDSIDGDITSSITSSGTIDTSTTGTYTIEYSVSDAAGNFVSVTRIVVISSQSSGGYTFSPLTLTNPPFSGTIYITGDIITSEDPSLFDEIVFNGTALREMYDRRNGGAWINIEPYLFNASFSDGLETEIQINPEFTLDEATVEANKYAFLIGQLPTALRKDVQTMWIHKGKEAYGGGNYNLLVHTGMTEYLENYDTGIVEETLIHEAAHTSLDAYHYPQILTNGEGWIEAVNKDGGCYISDYARDNPYREDISELMPLYVAVKFFPERISDEIRDKTLSCSLNRILYLDSLNLDMSLYEGEVPNEDIFVENNEEQTFLKRLNLKGFKYFQEDILNDPKNIYWFYDDAVFLRNFYTERYNSDGDCTFVSEGLEESSDGENIETKILKNTKNNLLIEVTYANGEKETLEFICEDLLIDFGGYFLNFVPNEISVIYDGDMTDVRIFKRTTLSYSFYCD